MGFLTCSVSFSVITFLKFILIVTQTLLLLLLFLLILLLLLLVVVCISIVIITIVIFLLSPLIQNATHWFVFLMEGATQGSASH